MFEQERGKIVDIVLVRRLHRGGDGFHQRMTDIQFQDRLCANAAPLARQQTLDLKIRPMFRGHETGRAVRKPLRGAHLGDMLAERCLHCADDSLGVGLIKLDLLVRRLFEQRHEPEIDIALAERLEGLAAEVQRQGGPERVDRIAQQQHLDAALARCFELGIGLEPLRALAGKVINLGLIGLQIGDIIFERPVATGGGGEPRELEERVAPVVILVKALLDDRAERLPDFPKASASFSARFSSSPMTRPVSALRICTTCGLFCSISREMLSGRSSLSTTPRMKRRYEGSSSAPSVMKTRRT